MNGPDFLPAFLAEKIDASGSCWLWLGKRSTAGYGYVRWPRDATKPWRPAHRIVYELIRGREIPSGLEIDHLCRNPQCVNPDHLEPVTHQENMRRAYATKMACNYGHDWNDLANVKVRKSGARVCTACRREQYAEEYRKWRARHRSDLVAT